MVDQKAVDRLLAERELWYESNLRIRDEDGNIVPFRLKYAQRVLERKAIECELRGVPAYFLILKARQLGCSTWAEAHLFRKTILEGNTRVLVTAHKEDASRNIFGMARRYYENLPEDVKPITKRSATNALHFEDNDSEFIVQTAGSGSGAGRSYTFSGWHGSECDLWPDSLSLFIAVMQAIPKVAGTIRIIESTSEGPSFLMHELWKRTEAGRGQFHAFFFPWYEDPKYSLRVTWAGLEEHGPEEWVSRNRDLIQAEREVGDAIHQWAERGNQHRAGGERRVLREAPRDGGQAEGEGGANPEGEPDEGAQPRGHGRDPGDARGREDHAGSRADGSREGKPPAESGRGDGKRANRGAARARPIGRRSHRHSVEPDSLYRAFRDSLTEYELGLIADLDLTYEQINGLRFLLESECNGDEEKRKREYPTYPEEAFEASGGDVLDQRVLAEWQEYATRNVPLRRGFFRPEYDTYGRPVLNNVWVNDRHGDLEIYEMPDPDDKYVVFVDCAQGTSDGDWHVAFVMSVKTGNQVAEYRSKKDPDEATDQVEMLGMLYNRALTAVETTGGWGWPFLSHLGQRSHLNGIQMYERDTIEKIGGQKVPMKRPGWETTTKTRPRLVALAKEAVRKRECQIRSLTTISECQTLYVNMSQGGKVEARPGKHDDGFIGFAGCVMLRSKVLSEMEFEEESAPEKKNPLFAFVHHESAARQRAAVNNFSSIELRDVVPARAIMPGTADLRRSSM
jgi:hypothetical protein